MAKAQLGSPNIIFRDVSINKDNFIDELVIPEDDIGYIGQSRVRFDSLVYCWKTCCETLRVVEIGDVLFGNYAMEINFLERRYRIYFVLEKVTFGPKNHKQAVATVIIEL
jgi:hypothetical protein